jgi:hypothetical protein
VERLVQEQHTREAKKAEETLAPTQVAQLSMASVGDLVARVRPRWGGGGDRRRTEDSVPRRRTEHGSRGATDLGRRRARSGGIRDRGVHRGAGGVARAGGAGGIWAGGGAARVWRSGGRMGIGMRGGGGSAGRRWEGRWWG